MKFEYECNYDGWVAVDVEKDGSSCNVTFLPERVSRTIGPADAVMLVKALALNYNQQQITRQMTPSPTLLEIGAQIYPELGRQLVRRYHGRNNPTAIIVIGRRKPRRRLIELVTHYADVINDDFNDHGWKVYLSNVNSLETRIWLARMSKVEKQEFESASSPT